MENDSLIAEQIMVEYRKLPGNSAKGFKEFANYESGPGYQLPGPGVPVQEPEEYPRLHLYRASCSLLFSQLSPC